MSFTIIHCPPTIEVGQFFEITLGNTHLAHGTRIHMQLFYDNNGERRRGVPMIHYAGQSEMSGPQVSRPRFAFHALMFRAPSVDKTFTIEFRLTRSYPYDDEDFNASCSIQVLPRSNQGDVKAPEGVYRQLTPDGPVEDSE